MFWSREGIFLNSRSELTDGVSVNVPVRKLWRFPKNPKRDKSKKTSVKGERKLMNLSELTCWKPHGIVN